MAHRPKRVPARRRAIFRAIGMLTEIMRQRGAADHFPLLGHSLRANLGAQCLKNDSAEAQNETQLA